MKIAILVALSGAGLWYNWKITRHWWSVQKDHLPPGSDVMGWVGVGFNALWYLFLFAFFAGLTLNNTVFR